MTRTWSRRLQGIHPQTAYRWFREGTFRVPAVRVNSRSVLVAPDTVIAPATGGTGLYARVSSHDHRADLDRQVARLTAWAAQRGRAVVRVEAEVGSGMNGARSKARRLLADPGVQTVVVEHRDRRKRNSLAAAGLTKDQWRREWESARLFLTADGEAGKPWGNETIRFNPDEGWLELKLPAPLAHLANRPFGRYRLSCPVAFSYRGDEVAAQAATGPVRYDIALDAASGRWYLDASWRTPELPAPSPGELRCAPVVAVDVNVGHLAAAVVTPDGNILGAPVTVPLDLAGLPAATRDGRLRAAISALVATAKDHGALAIVIEDLDFAEARSEGRERAGSRPSRGRRGRGFRRAISGIPTGKFRDRLVQMTFNAGLAVVAVDPAYTSRWGAGHWLGPLRAHHPQASGHHATAVVTGRRALGHRARRRAGVTGTGQRTSGRRAAPRAPMARRTDRNGRPRQAQRQPPPWHKTATARRPPQPDQAAHDRSRPPAEQYSLPLSD